jgi:C-terminal processing protease CtpA/Prc
MDNVCVLLIKESCNRNMKTKAFFFLILLSAAAIAQNKTFTPQQYKEDFEFFWKSINDDYCYFNKKQTDWIKAKEIYSKQVDTITSRTSFITCLEQMFYELYDHHCSLNTNTKTSQRLVPTGTDMWAEFINGKPIITEVRKGFGADKAGIVAGMQVTAVNNVPVDEAMLPFIGKAQRSIDVEAKNFALRLLLAGNHIAARKVSAKYNKDVVDFYPDKDGLQLENFQYKAKVESKKMQNIGYIRINNFLFDNSLIKDFDSALNSLMSTQALIIDLRETPSGGNTTVARAILSRFITKEQFYQKHELYAEEKETGIKRSWEEIVSPRGVTYTKPLVVLANHWTGSISEGITIAFDGLKRATVVGTQLARLNGAIYSYEMPNTKIHFSFPVERLYHVNGLPRELYKPTIEVDMTKQKPGEDLILEEGLSILKKKITSRVTNNKSL